MPDPQIHEDHMYRSTHTLKVTLQAHTYTHTHVVLQEVRMVPFDAII